MRKYKTSFGKPFLFTRYGEPLTMITPLTYYNYKPHNYI